MSKLGRLAVVGQGYVGLPLAMRAAEVGWQVVGYDISESRVALLASGSSPIEDVHQDRLQEALASGRYVPSNDPSLLAGFDVAVVCVPTPLRGGVPDLSYIQSACLALSAHVSAGSTVILESTTYPGTTEEFVRPLLEGHTGMVAGESFHIGYSPERIDPGNAVWRLENTPKIVSGLTLQCLSRVRDFYQTIVAETVPVSSTTEAELVKLLENTFRHVNIALVNEFVVFSREFGISFRQVLNAASTKPFGYMKFTPGPGVGGHCIPIDPVFLSWRSRQLLGRSFRFIELAQDVNAYMPSYIVGRLTKTLNARGLAIRGRRILLLGLAYKKNTADARESPSVQIATLLASLGANVRCADPHVGVEQTPEDCRRVVATAEEAARADAVVLLVDHDAFNLPLITKASQYFLDCRYVASGPNVDYL